MSAKVKKIRIGRLTVELWKADWGFFVIPLFCGCRCFAFGPLTVNYVRKSSRCYPHKKCTDGRNVQYHCGCTMFVGWGIPDSAIDLSQCWNCAETPESLR